MTNPSRGLPAAQASRAWGVGKLLDLLLAAVAHVLVLGAWALTAAALMGTLAIPRRMVMNSEWVFDTGRLPQPWVIPIGFAAVAVSHLLFGWTMRRFGDGVAAYGPSVVAWVGALAGVALGAYLWSPPVQVGRKVGPSSGQFTPWDAVGYVAYYARLWLPALVAAITAGLVLFSKQSPWRALLAGRRSARQARRPRRARVAAA